MRFIASGDHHFDQHSRFEECQRVHGAIAELVERERPDAFLSGGDIYERASTPLERAAVAEWLSRIAEVCPVVIAKGNHDRDLDVALLGRLKTRHRVIAEEACAVHVVGGAAIATVAWPRKGALLAGAADSASADDAAREALRRVLLGLGHALDEYELPRVLLGHFMVDGSVTSVGQPLLGAELNVGLTDLALARAQIGILGHIHAPQEWTFGDATYAYTGSPFRTSFGEVETKSVILAEVTRAGMSWARVPTPATPMLLLTARALDGVFRLDDPGVDVRGAEVRLRYEVTTDARDMAKRAALETRDRMLEIGAISVRVEEEVVTTTRARAPEIARATTLEEKLAAFWRVKGVELTEARAERVIARAREMEASR